MSRRPHDGAVRPQVATLVLVGVVAGRQPGGYRYPGLYVVGVVVVGPQPADEQLGRPAEQDAARRVHPGRKPVEPEDDRTDSGLLEDDLEPGLGRPAHLLGLDSFRLVLDGAHELEHRAVVGKLRQRPDVDPPSLGVRADDPEGDIHRDAPLDGCRPRLAEHVPIVWMQQREEELGVLVQIRVQSQDAEVLSRARRHTRHDIELEAAEPSDPLRLGHSAAGSLREHAAQPGSR